MDLHRLGRGIADRTLDFTRLLVEKYKSRITGTRQCLGAAKEIATAFSGRCDTVREETFDVHPGALWNAGRAATVAYLISLVLLVIGGACVYIAAGVCLLTLFYVIAHYLCFGGIFDKLFRRTTGCNIVGTIEPIQDVKQQILVVGHHDSPYVLSFMAKLQKLAGLRLGLAVFAYLYITVLSIVACIEQAVSGAYWMLYGIHVPIALAGILFVSQLFFVMTRKPSPGAGDNLNASSIAASMADYFSERKSRGEPLQHSRVIFLSTDAEEAGLKGAWAYASKYRAQLAGMPTYVLNIDSVYALEHLGCLTRDCHGTMPLSRKMADECCRIAAGLGYKLKKVALGLGGGGTDAAAFAKCGIEATTIIGMSTSMFDEGRVYHTMHDTVETIAPEAVEAVLDIGVNYILNKDSEIAG